MYTSLVVFDFQRPWALKSLSGTPTLAAVEAPLSLPNEYHIKKYSHLYYGDNIEPFLLNCIRDAILLNSHRGINMSYDTPQ